MTPILLNDFKLTLLQQKPKPTLIHPFDKVPPLIQITPIVQQISSQLTNNGKFLKFTRK
jgi:hypothetical protein